MQYLLHLRDASPYDRGSDHEEKHRKFRLFCLAQLDLWPWSEVAAELGYPSAEAASKEAKRLWDRVQRARGGESQRYRPIGGPGSRSPLTNASAQAQTGADWEF